MKIIFDANPITQNNKSGVGYFTTSLISALSRSGKSDTQLIGHYFNFLGKKDVEDLPKATNITFKRSRLFPTKVLNIGRRLGVQLPFEVFSREKADITLFTNFTAMPTLFGGKRVSIIYDVSYLDCPEYAPDRLVSYLKKWVPYTIRTSDLVIVNSEFTKRRLINKYNINNDAVQIIPIPPIKHTAPDNMILDKIDLRNKGYILFVGTIEPRKNIETLLEAYSKLDKNIIDKYPLVLAGGKGWKDTDILYRIKSLQEQGLNIKQTGYVTDAEKSALYEHATLCVQASLYEGFGMPILEAMSYGIPIICSNIDVFREVAGDSAIYFDPKSPESITNCIDKVLNNTLLIKKLVQKSKKRIEEYPTWDQIGKELHETLLKL